MLKRRRVLVGVLAVTGLLLSACSSSGTNIAASDALPQLLKEVPSETMVDASDCPLVNPIALQEMLTEEYPEYNLRFFASASGLTPQGSDSEASRYPLISCSWTEFGDTPRRGSGPDRQLLLSVNAFGGSGDALVGILNETRPGVVEQGMTLPMSDPWFVADAVSGFDAAVFVVATFPTEEGFLDEILAEAKRPLKK